MVVTGGRPPEPMSKHQTNLMMSSFVADALAATPNITHVRTSRTDDHSGVQFDCYLGDEPADVTVITAATKPEVVVQAAYTATERDSAHLIIAPDEVSGRRINRWLRAPMMNATDAGIQLYRGMEAVERNEMVAVTAAETTMPEWWVRGTDADTDRTRVCELRYDDQVLATYDIEDGTTRFEDNSWIEIDRQEGDKACPAVAPIADRRTVSRPATWDPITRPLTIPSTVSLTDSAVYALPAASDDGLTQIDTALQRTESEWGTDYERTAAVVDELLRQRTVASPTAAIGYDAVEMLAASWLQTEGREPSKLLISKALTNADCVTIKQTAEDGRRQLCGRAWALPPPCD